LKQRDNSDLYSFVRSHHSCHTMGTISSTTNYNFQLPNSFL